MPKIDSFFKHMIEQNASDLHLSVGSRPRIRLHGTLKEMESPELNNNLMQEMLFEIITEAQKKAFIARRDLDFAYEVPGLARFRANYLVQKRGLAAVFRVIPTDIKGVDALGVPQQVLKFADMNRGLVLVTGPTGSGKSTTLAALIDYINAGRKEHILTIEDPIEFVHQSKKCLVTQREVGTHTKSFSAALRAALREDPDVILVGELRDLETIELAVTAAETGHLVFGTLHTNSAAKTVDRIIDAFPADQQAQIRTMLSESLKGVVSQQLLKRSDRAGRVPAMEILFVKTSVANLIREGKTFQIPSIIQTGKGEGMQLMDQAIMEYLMQKVISPEEAHTKCSDKSAFEQFLTGKGAAAGPGAPHGQARGVQTRGAQTRPGMKR
jgi:twitching motility protein PilT